MFTRATVYRRAISRHSHSARQFDPGTPHCYHFSAGWSSLVARWAHNLTAPKDSLEFPGHPYYGAFANWASGAAMHRKITRQSRWNLRRVSDKAIPNQASGMVGEGVETGWRASLGDEGTVRLSSKGESDRITQRSAVQIRPPATMNAIAEMQWRSPLYRD